MLNIVVPMAGRGSRFAVAGYTQPKPLIPVHGVPMIELVIRNLTPRCDHRFTFICQKEASKLFALRSLFERCCGSSHQVIEIDGITEGAACTVLKAAHLIDTDEPLMIANCDQYVDVDIDMYLAALRGDKDGLIMTMDADDPKWSFVSLDAAGLAQRVVEKQVISRHATVGIYNFSRGRDFVRAARLMIARDERVNNEFYVAPVYNQLIAEGLRIAVSGIGREGQGMYGLGVPADLDAFLANPQSRHFVEKSQPVCVV